jgi:hypothetical protein
MTLENLKNMKIVGWEKVRKVSKRTQEQGDKIGKHLSTLK